MFTFYEFFAGGGMARAGLGEDWRCLFANDFDPKKSASYEVNWGNAAIKTEDVAKIRTKDLPGVADAIWASFPCQDLSLAGAGAGLRGERSGTYWPFWDIVKGLAIEGREPKIVALENVCGALTSHGGKDFAAICSSLERASYRFGALVIDASLFLPHSRPRLFIVAIKEGVAIPAGLIASAPSLPWHSKALNTAYEGLSPKLRKNWLWWNLKVPPLNKVTFADLLEGNPSDVKWHSSAETKQLLSMMSEVNLAKVSTARRAGRRIVGTVYKRTRLDDKGNKVQRAEVRFDDLSGCLRTPAGGSSRQTIMVVEGNSVRSRLISGRETARLMGLPDTYKLPIKYNDAYHLTGDGVVVPVVRHLAAHLFEPILFHNLSVSKIAA